MKSALLLICLIIVIAGCRLEREGNLPGADLIFENGQIWTAVNGAAQAEAVAVSQGKIQAVGSRGEVARFRGPDTQVIDLQGRFLMPGFIDNHTHFMDGGFQLLGLDLRSAASPEEFIARIRAYAGRTSQGAWITGGEWDHEAWPQAELPRREWIDPVTPETPVLVKRLDGHMALANSKALRMAAIDATTPDPAGGMIVRDEGGNPTGLLRDAAMDLVWRVVPRPAEADYREAALAALEEARSLGVTSVNAMSSFDEVRVYQQLLEEGKLTVRIYAITPLSEFEKLQAVGVQRGFGGPFLKIGAVKGYMDGSLGSTTAWFYDPYLDASESTGLPSAEYLSGQIHSMVQAADRARLQLAVHAIGNRANDELLNIFQKAAALNGPADRRFRIEHAQHLSGDAIARFRELGVIASMQPYHAIDDGRWAEKRIGPEQIRTTYAFRSLLDAGAVLTFGSDWSVAPLNPLLGVFAAVTRRTLDGRNPGGWVPEEMISAEEALVCYTRNNAFAIFAENELGTLEPGKWADLVVLSENPLAVDAEAIGGIQVLRTVVAGATVFEGD